MSKTKYILPLLSFFFLSSGCSSSHLKPVYLKESFDSETPYQQRFVATPNAACEAARRALLSQGYLVTGTQADHVSAQKSFQPEYEVNIVIEFNVTCAPSGSQQVLAFANAVQVRYEMKKASSSASLGVSAIGSISLPVGNNNDSLVRVGNETITDHAFYDRFFTLMKYHLSLSSEVELVPMESSPSKSQAPAFPPSEHMLDLPNPEPKSGVDF